MAVAIKALNGDLSFLLSFSPAPDADASEVLSVLVDPWIVESPATTISTWVATLKRQVPSCIASIAELDPQPDILCLTTAGADHLHADTLQTLPNDTDCKIVACPAAAAAVRKLPWLTQAKDLSVLEYYDASKPVADSTFTYHHRARSSKAGSSSSKESLSSSTSSHSDAILGTLTLDLVPLAGDYTALHFTLVLTYTATTPAGTRSTTILYSPHGTTAQQITSFLSARGPSASAFPPSPLPSSSSSDAVTLLIHPCNTSNAPWYLGSASYVYGAAHGIQIARAIGATAWIRAHDEEKNLRGILSFAQVPGTVESAEVRGMMRRAGLDDGSGEMEDGGRAGADEQAVVVVQRCELVEIPVGEVWRP